MASSSPDMLLQVGMVATPAVLGFLASSPVRRYKQLYYRDVKTPRYQVPNKAFGIIWGTMYLFQGYASLLVYAGGCRRGISTAAPLGFYAAQLACNIVWPTVFFRNQDYLASFYIALTTLVLLSITAYQFKQVDVAACRLMVPNLVWLCISTFFNRMVYRDNIGNPLLRRHLALPTQQPKAD